MDMKFDPNNINNTFRVYGNKPVTVSAQQAAKADELKQIIAMANCQDDSVSARIANMQPDEVNKQVLILRTLTNHIPSQGQNPEINVDLGEVLGPIHILENAQGPSGAPALEISFQDSNLSAPPFPMSPNTMKKLNVTCTSAACSLVLVVPDISLAVFQEGLGETLRLLESKQKLNE